MMAPHGQGPAGDQLEAYRSRSNRSLAHCKNRGPRLVRAFGRSYAHIGALRILLAVLMAIGMSKGGDMRDPRDTYQNQLVPMVVEQTNRGERAYDIYSRLLRSYCSWKLRIRTRKSRCTSTPRAGW